MPNFPLMKRMLILLGILCLLTKTLCFAQGIKKWYVSPSGTNTLTNGNGTSPNSPLQSISFAVNTAWAAGDTIFVMNGTYRNPGYGNGSLNNGPVVNLNGNTKTGSANGWLVIKNHPGHRPKIQFDGAGGFIGNQQTYLEIAGFEIEGPNQQITQSQALANRLLHDKYFSGRGIAIWSGHHIYIHDNIVHDCPNSGIRVNNGDYCTIDRNEVYNCTWWSSSAESAIVYATAKDIDTRDTIKMVITNNLVYDNFNTVPFYNGTPTGGGSTYGTVDQDYIIDGSGCYVTRNRDTYFYGWFYFANNVCYGNGINGLVVHKTDRAIVTNNTCFMNGSVPLSSGRQSSSGITINGSSYVRMYNNISWARYNSDYGYKIYSPGRSTNFIAANNILAKGKSDYTSSQFTFVDPQFVDTLNKDFRILAASPAVDAGIIHTHLPDFDYNQNLREASKPDIGAFELISTLTGVDDDLLASSSPKAVIFPNPASTHFTISASIDELKKLELYDLAGNHLNVKENLANRRGASISLDISHLPKGIYILKTKTTAHKIQKK